MNKKNKRNNIIIFLGKIESPVLDAILRFLKFTSDRKTRLCVAAVTALITLILTIICDRIPHSFGNEELTMKKLQLASMLTGGKTKPIPSDILPVNISFDRQLTPVNDEYGIPCGVIDVADRRKLLDFLSRIKDADYAAIAIDIFFDSSMPAKGDSALFKCINGMKRLTVPVHSDGTISPLIDKKLHSNGDYAVNLISNNFSKYNFAGGDGIPSMAQTLFNNSHNVKNYKPGIFDNTTMILPLPVSLENSYTEEGDKVWYNLGTDILDVSTDEELRNLVKGKRIIIGDYCMNDIHDSYVGYISGPAIVINALTALEEGKTKINIWSMLLTYIVYFIIAWFLIMNLTLWKVIGWNPRPIMNFILSFIGVGAILFLLQLTHFVIFTEFHDTLLATTFLSLYSIYCQKLNEHYAL